MPGELKDKVEVVLDSRQIFFLVFGGAVAFGLVFMLGLLTGKRVEQRAHLARAHGAASDPLSALDELGADEPMDDLAFPSALAGGQKGKPLGAADVAPAVPEAQARPAPVSPPSRPVPSPAATPAATVVKVPPAKAAAKPAAKGPPKFTLHLSSFPARAEAEALATKLQSSGYRAVLVPSDVPGQGTVYRVRVGQFVTHEEAVAAKSDFEKRQHVIAYVSKL